MRADISSAVQLKQWPHLLYPQLPGFFELDSYAGEPATMDSTRIMMQDR